MSERLPPFVGSFDPPAPPSDDRIWLEPLGPEHTDRDYAAIMGSRARLRYELQWKGWPREGFTTDDNRADLVRHRAEHDRREAFTYTVLDPSRARCLGCAYLEPHRGGGRLAYWVIDDELETGLESHLVEVLLGWFEERWPLERVVLPITANNQRSARLLEGLGLRESLDVEVDGHRCFGRRQPG